MIGLLVQDRLRIKIRFRLGLGLGLRLTLALSPEQLSPEQISDIRQYNIHICLHISGFNQFM